MHHADNSIVLPRALVHQLDSIPAGALKVFIYLCSLNTRQPFAASASTICRNTGLKKRAVIKGVNALREHKLIEHERTSGKPNLYRIVFAEAAKPEPAKAPEQQSAVPKQPPSIEQLIVRLYPKAQKDQINELRAEMTEDGLRQALHRLAAAGGVAPEMDFRFFTNMLMSQLN